MADRTVAARLRLEVGQYVANAKIAARATRDLRAEVVQTARKHEQEFTAAGTALAGFGAATVGALALATKAAVDWESAWAGVTKTTDGTATEMQALEDGLRELARTLPATHTEIAAVAEAAGQLGIKRDDIVDFTETMIALGETTNLTAEDAATSIAQMANVMGTSGDEIDNLGATLVALGNDGASTEKQIVEMAQRISGAAAVVGLSEGEVLAFANTVASMGIEVEAGGSSVSRVLTDMSKAAQSGGEELNVFAETAGVSAQEFSKAFSEDPAEAFALFIEGLGGVQAAGGNVFAVLEQLGLSDVRVSQALLGMASSGDLLRDSLKLQSEAWRDNTALAEEAAKRYDTTEARMQRARNQITDAAIDIGDTFLPILANAAEAVGGLAGAFQSLPDPVKSAGAQLAGMAGVASLAAGGLLLVVPRAVETVDAFRTMSREMPRASRAMQGVARAAAGLAVLQGAAMLGEALGDWSTNAVPGVEAMTKALLDAADAGGNVDAAFAENMPGIDSFTGALGRIVDKNLLETVGDGLFKIGTLGSVSGRNIKQAEESFTALDASLTGMAQSGATEQAAAQFQAYADAGLAAGYSIEEVNGRFPDYLAYVQDSENKARLAADGTTQFGNATETASTQIGNASEAASEYATEMGLVGDEASIVASQLDATAERAGLTTEDFLSWRDELAGIIGSFAEPLAAYQSALEEKQAAAQKAAEKAAEVHNESIDARIQAAQRDHEARVESARANGEVSDSAIAKMEEQRDATVQGLEDQRKSWEDYPTDVKVSVDEYLAELTRQVEAQANWEVNMLTLAGQVSQGTLDELARMGPEGAPLVQALVDAGVGKTAEMDRLMSANSQSTADNMSRIFTEAGPVLAHVLKVDGEKMVQALAAELEAGEITVEQIARNYGIALDGQVIPAANRADEAFGHLKDAINEVPRSIAPRTTTPGLPGSTRGVKDLRDYLDDIKGTYPVKVGVSYFAQKSGGPGNVPFRNDSVGLAHGGPVPNRSGMGRRSYDTEPAMLRVDEHVWTPEEVDAAGGHEAMRRMRRDALSGRLRGGERRPEPGWSDDDCDWDDDRASGTFSGVPYKNYKFQRDLDERRRLAVAGSAPLFSLPSAAAAWDNIADLDVERMFNGGGPIRTAIVEQINAAKDLYGRAYYETGRIQLNAAAERTARQRRATAIHEIGHVIGLPHPGNPRAHSIMATANGYGTDSLAGPTAFDKAAIRELFPERRGIPRNIREEDADVPTPRRSGGALVPSFRMHTTGLQRPKTAASPVIAELDRYIKENANAWARENALGGTEIGTGEFRRNSRGWPAREYWEVSPNTAAAVDFVRSRWGVRDIGTLGKRANTSDHPWGKALDVMTYRNKALGNEIASWFVSNPGEFGTKYVIFDQKINSGSGWRRMEDRGSPTANHEDHPHISLFDRGGKWRHGTGGFNASGGDEYVLNRGLTTLLRDVTPALDRLASQTFTPTAVLGAHANTSAQPPVVNVSARVFVGDREITDIVRVEVDDSMAFTAGQVEYGRAGV